MNQKSWPTSFDPETGIAFAEAGRGPLLLCLHGLFDTSYTWHRLFPVLSEKVHLVAPDLPGFGRTPLPMNWGESVTAQVESLLRFSDRWKGEKMVLVGSSMGGGLALLLAAARADRFDRIVLLNPYAGSSVPIAVAAAKQPFIGALIPLLLAGPLRRFWIRAIFSRSLYAQEHLTGQYVWELDHALRSFSRRKGVARFLRQIDPGVIRRAEASLPKLRQETLLVWGEEDRWLSPDHADRLQALLSRCKRENIAQCGHLPHLERPDEVGAAILEFLGGRICQKTVL